MDKVENTFWEYMQLINQMALTDGRGCVLIVNVTSAIGAGLARPEDRLEVEKLRKEGLVVGFHGHDSRIRRFSELVQLLEQMNSQTSWPPVESSSTATVGSGLKSPLQEDSSTPNLSMRVS